MLGGSRKGVSLGFLGSRGHRWWVLSGTGYSPSTTPRSSRGGGRPPSGPGPELGQRKGNVSVATRGPGLGMVKCVNLKTNRRGMQAVPGLVRRVAGVPGVPV